VYRLILLSMQPNTLEEWQRLSALYGQMGDIEIRELAAGIGDLTEVAQQVLRDELKKRGLSEAPPPAENLLFSNYPNGLQGDPLEDSPEEANAGEDDGTHEFTWKTPLCECDTSKEAMQLVLALRQAGIDSWVERPQSAASYPRVTVAADQLELARLIASRPIPQEIVDEVNDESPAFEIPACPKCGGADPTLESANLSNSWHCESCGYDWIDPLEGPSPDARVPS
jgi:hypothetical protein